MRRRRYLALGGVAFTTAVAGCAGGSNGSGDTPPEPDPDASAASQLPEEGNDWTQTEENDQEAGMVGAQDGVQGRYEIEGDSYTVEILRWGSSDNAETNGGDVYAGWTRFITHGVFSFAANGPEGERCEELLARSPALSEEMF